MRNVRFSRNFAQNFARKLVNQKDDNVLSEYDVKTIVHKVRDEDYREQLRKDPTIMANTANLRAVLLLGQAHANNRRLMRAGKGGCGTNQSSHHITPKCISDST